ncbi:c-type cytochrome [Myxococcota bacterium]|nr:c-type cytochrome [Myxococcota bacterium]
MSSIHWLACASSVAVACAPEPVVPSLASSTLVASEDQATLFAVSTDDGMLAAIDVATEHVTRVEAGVEPTRLARAAGRIFVTLRGERAVAVFDERSLELQRKIDVGAEPVGIVARHDGTRVYVASSLSHRIDELDAESFEVLRTWDVGAEPRWLAIHPRGRMLYVGLAFGDAWAWIDLDDGHRHGGLLPAVLRQQLIATSIGIAVTDVALAGRITGDPAITADGAKIYWPALYADTTTPLAETATAAATGGFLATSGYQNRFEPVLVAVPLAIDGEPLWTRGVAVDVRTSSFAGLPATGQSLASSYPSAIALSSDDALAIVAMEGTRAVSLFQLRDLEAASGASGLTAGSSGVASGVSSSGSGTLSIPGRRPGLSGDLLPGGTLAIRTDAGPRGLAVSGGRVWIDTFLSRSVSNLDLASIERYLTTDDVEERVLTGRTIEASRPIEITSRVLDEERDAGRRLFYTANDGRVSGHTSGVSCATCHVDGRNDGLSWSFEVRGLRQTPSLAGPVHLTEPLGWEGAVPTLVEEVVRTSTGRMGGTQLTMAEAGAIAAYLRGARDVDVPDRGTESDVITRGRALFVETGCASCHSGPRLTDNTNHAVLGFEATKTRSLVGIVASPPYLHDGSAKTLRDVLVRARDGSMGDTSGLTDEELDDLEAYLKSL